MTHQTYTQTELEAMTVSQLKTIAGQLGTLPDGDKRVKRNWVSAVLDHQILEKSSRSSRKSTETQSQQQVQERLQVVGKVVEKSETENAESSPSNGLTTATTHGSESSRKSSRSSQPTAAIDNPPPEPNVPASRKVGYSIVLIVLAAILYAVCLVPLGLGILTYRLVGWCRQRFGNQARSSRSSRIDYFPFPA
jgi:hypothetical protein